MDQAATNVADEAKKPENNQDDNYSPEHRYSLSVEFETFVGVFIQRVIYVPSFFQYRENSEDGPVRAISKNTTCLCGFHRNRLAEAAEVSAVMP